MDLLGRCQDAGAETPQALSDQAGSGQNFPAPA